MERSVPVRSRLRVQQNKSRVSLVEKRYPGLTFFEYTIDSISFQGMLRRFDYDSL